MLTYTNYQLVRGINPNLAAGQRALKVSPAYTISGGVFVHQPNNSAFYNFGSGPFTIYFRILFLGAQAFDGGSNELAFINKASGGGTGWVTYLKGNLGDTATNPLRLQFGFFQAGANAQVYANDPWPMDGRFHSGCVVRRTSTAGEAQDLNNVLLYIDGQLVTNRTNVGAMVNFDTANEILIGGGSPRWLRGYIDTVAFYSVGLTDAEIVGLDDPATRTDRQAKFISTYNQIGQTNNDILDATSLQNHGYAEFTPGSQGQAFPLVDGLCVFAAGATLAAPINGAFTPVRRAFVTHLYRYDTDLTAVEYSLDNVTWVPVAFDAAGRSTNFTSQVIDPATTTPTLYVRATNANLTWQNALELHY